jgi:hypothetical protein
MAEIAFFGTVFSVNTNGSAFTPLHGFSGENNGDGSKWQFGVIEQCPFREGDC